MTGIFFFTCKIIAFSLLNTKNLKSVLHKENYKIDFRSSVFRKFHEMIFYTNGLTQQVFGNIGAADSLEKHLVHW